MIHGNTRAIIQLKTTTKNAIGEREVSWTDIQTLFGWLDLQSGDSNYTNYNAKIQESSHVFLSDYVKLDSRVKADKCRMVIGNEAYDIMLIDNPMGMNRQLEFYLKYTGGK